MLLIPKRHFVFESGFTLIELLIVIAIIAILAAIALPMYQDYTIRTRIAEALTAGSAVKSNITQNISNNGGILPADACIGFTDISTVTNNVVSVTCTPATGAIKVLTTAKAGSTVLTLTPTATANGVTWVCSADIAKYAPVECR